mmetsp:Transcript_40296/g.120188  ORF Transcript_40296/g.120188 Transcript_40296/m.120188 type:complete len:147 (+) Transcript_40296:131-571(+)
MSISLFDRAYGRPASRESSWSCHEAAPWESTWPCAPAGAPQRPAGAIGPVAPTTLGMAEQASCMMLASGTFGHEAAARDKLRFGGQLRSKPEPLPALWRPSLIGEHIIGPLGYAVPLVDAAAGSAAALSVGHMRAHVATPQAPLRT